MLFNHIILATLWIAYCALHSVLASERLKKCWRRRMKNARWYRLWYNLFAFVFLIALVCYQITIPTIKLFEQDTFIFAAGILLSFFGFILMIVCIQKYFMSLSGLRSLVTENYSNELQVSGIHKYIRHPLYLGTFVFIWGLFLWVPNLSLLIADIIITAYTLIGIELEEKKLVLEYGDRYTEYKRKVPKLIPFSKPKRTL